MKISLMSATAISAVLLASAPAFADAETEALKKEIKALEARINELEKRETAAAPIPKGYATSAPAVDKKLEQRVAIVERNQELAQEDAKAKAATTPAVSVGNKGLLIASPDKQYSLNLRAYAQIDNRSFFDSGNHASTGANSTFLVRTARPILEGKMTDYFNARLMWDFGQGNSRLLDAYGDFHPLPGNDIINFRAGQFKTPVGLERWQSEQEIEFTERAMTTNLVPFRDIGVMAYGQFIPDQLEYQLAYVNGASDLAINSVDADSNKDIDARLFAHPFRWADIPLLEGLGIGIGGSYGNHQGTATASNLTTGYLTPAQRVFYAYNAGAFANGTQWRLNPQIMYYNGPFGAFGEYVRNTQEVKVGTTEGDLQNNAWFAMAGYVLTGEDASFDGVKPAHNFNPAKGEWGAFELVGRYGELNVDKRAFPLFANPTTSARNAYETTVGANWYLNNSVKVNLDYAYTTFDGGATLAAGGDKHDEQALLARTQLRF